MKSTQSSPIPSSPKTRPLQGGRAAFTLIELLVVIAIIAILAALAFPALGRVQQNADSAKCSSNLRQIGIALTAFVGDNDGSFPLAQPQAISYSSSNPPTPPLGWTQQLEKYLPTAGGTDLKIFTCPSSSKIFHTDKNYSYFLGCKATYLANQGSTPPTGVKPALLQHSTQYILAGDIASDSIYTDTDDNKSDATANICPAFHSSDETAKIHLGKSNLLFADGHVGSFDSFQNSQMTVDYEHMVDYSGANHDNNQ